MIPQDVTSLGHCDPKVDRPYDYFVTSGELLGITGHVPKTLFPAMG